MHKRSYDNPYTAIRRLPDAVAIISGGPKNSKINGTVRFYEMRTGVLVVSDMFGLPTKSEECGNDIFAFHIHNGSECTGNEDDPFFNAGTHYNPSGCPHPYHKGDMPPLFSANGRAFLAFFTDRFTLNEIIGKAVVIHNAPDDFTTQPSGNSGNKIACGIISKVRR